MGVLWARSHNSTDCSSCERSKTQQVVGREPLPRASCSSSSSEDSSSIAAIIFSLCFCCILASQSASLQLRSCKTINKTGVRRDNLQHVLCVVGGTRYHAFPWAFPDVGISNSAQGSDSSWFSRKGAEHTSKKQHLIKTHWKNMFFPQAYLIFLPNFIHFSNMYIIESSCKASSCVIRWDIHITFPITWAFRTRNRLVIFQISRPVNHPFSTPLLSTSISHPSFNIIYITI